MQNKDVSQVGQPPKGGDQARKQKRVPCRGEETIVLGQGNMVSPHKEVTEELQYIYD